MNEPVRQLPPEGRFFIATLRRLRAAAAVREKKRETGARQVGNDLCNPFEPSNQKKGNRHDAKQKNGERDRDRRTLGQARNPVTGCQQG